MQENTGFTLIELMLVVAILTILSTVALPKFADFVRKSKEAKIKGDLGALKGAFNIYLADNEGVVPLMVPDLEPTYIKEIPTLEIPGHEPSAQILFWGLAWPPNDTIPRWIFYNPGGGVEPRITIACTHKDSRGVYFYNYDLP